MKKIILILICFLCFSYLTAQTKATNNRDSLSFELCQLYGLDQGVRENGIWSTLSKQTKLHIDSVCFEKLIVFIEKYGFPNEELLGEQNYSQECVENAAFAILLHSPHRLVEPEIYELLRKELEKGNVSSGFLEIVLDKYYVVYKKKSLFNSAFKSWIPSKGVCIQDREESDRVRIDIGLEVLPDSVFVHCSEQ